MKLFDHFINPLKLRHQKITEKYSGRLGKKRLGKLLVKILGIFCLFIILMFVWIWLSQKIQKNKFIISKENRIYLVLIVFMRLPMVYPYAIKLFHSLQTLYTQMNH